MKEKISKISDTDSLIRVQLIRDEINEFMELFNRFKMIYAVKDSNGNLHGDLTIMGSEISRCLSLPLNDVQCRILVDALEKSLQMRYDELKVTMNQVDHLTLDRG